MPRGLLAGENRRVFVAVVPDSQGVERLVDADPRIVHQG
jgi:hypothetical protein